MIPRHKNLDHGTVNLDPLEGKIQRKRCPLAMTNKPSTIEICSSNAKTITADIQQKSQLWQNANATEYANERAYQAEHIQAEGKGR